MIREFTKKIILPILFVAIFSFGLSGCVDIIVPGPPEPETGTVQIEITNDKWTYEVYMDGDDLTGSYLGETDMSGEGTFYDVPTGDRSFYVISTDGLYDGWGYKTIDTGNNLVEIGTSPTGDNLL